MCPACIGTLALAVAGATSAGGLTALAVKTLRARIRTTATRKPTNQKRRENE